MRRSLVALAAVAEVLLRARDLGVIFVVSTDAHHTSEMNRMQWGMLQSARGFVDRTRVANTWSRDEFLEWAATKREQ